MTIYVSLVKVRSDANSEVCDSTEFGMNRFCDPYAKFTLSDGESEPQVFTTRTIPDAVGFTKVDETFYSKKLRKDKLTIKVEIYDSNDGNVFADDEKMFERSMNLTEFTNSFQIGTEKKTSEVGYLSHWTPEFIRNSLEITRT